MPLLVISKFDEDPVKNEGICPIISLWEVFFVFFLVFFRRSRASNSKPNSPISIRFELRRDFMPVLIICKFDVDPIQK